MELKQDRLFAEINNSKIYPVIYLAGSEVSAKDKIVKRIKEVLNADDFNFYETSGDKIEMGELLAIAQTAPVFSDKRLVIVNRADKFSSKEEKSLIEYLNNPMPTTCLVLVGDDTKKTNALYKKCAEAGAAAVFYPLSPYEAQSWIAERVAQENFTINNDAAKLITDIAGTDLNALENEIQKSVLYLANSASKNITAQDVLALSGFNKEENPYDLQKYIFDADFDKAIALSGKLIEDAAPALTLIGIITGCIVKIIKVKRLKDAGYNNSEIFSAAYLHPYFDKDFIRQTDNFVSLDKLINALAKALEYEAKLKSSSSEDEQSLVSALLMLTASAAKRR